MKLQRSVLRSVVGRRLLLLFVGCALVPVGTLAVLSFQTVSDQLYEQSRDRLMRASKASGMEVLGRLLALEAELARIEPRRPLDAATRARLGGLFEAITFEPERGAPLEAILGSPSAPPEPDREERAHLAAGKTLLSIAPGPGGARRVLLTREVAGAGRLTAEAAHGHLFDISHENTLPPGGEFCVLGPDLGTVSCSRPQLGPIRSAVRPRISLAPSGDLRWTGGGEDLLASYWSLFLKPTFFADALVFVVSEPEAVALAPVATFRTLFPLLLLGTLFLVVLVSLQQIRRRLVPLERLREATHRIGRGDFDARVEVASGDEFEELASSFNQMTARLNEQFVRLGSLIEADRAILSALDTTTVAQVALARIREFYPCDACAVFALEPDAPGAAQSFIGHVSVGGELRIEVSALPASEARLLMASPEQLIVGLDDGGPRFLDSLARTGVRYVVVLPLFVKGDFFGAVALGHREERPPADENTVYARQLADQVATALANVHAIEEKRVLAYYDALTELPNRLLFKERVGQALAAARRERRPIAVCIVELDDFKKVNDSLGHDSGDEILVQVGRRITGALRDGSLARLGGDEFGILLDALRSIDDAARVARRVVEEIQRPFHLHSQTVFLTASVGIAVYPDDAEDVESLVRNADTAVYYAKDRGKNAYQFFTDSMNASATQRLSLESALREALERGEFSVAYQPVVDVATREILGAEALLRWQRPDGSFLSPAEFIPVAEQTGLIVPIGEWVLRAACRQSVAWQQSDLAAVRVAVNLSSRQLQKTPILETISSVLAETGLDPQLLGLELTESMLMEAESHVLDTLHALREMGVRLSVDDFGTGYSSLSYLKKFPVHNLKIDRAFVRDLPGNTDDAAITSAIVAMGHSLKLQIIAEGVETEEQLAFLRNAGCDAAQGYLFSKPVPSDEFVKLLRETTAPA